jgi:hypothetical protein
MFLEINGPELIGIYCVFINSSSDIAILNKKRKTLKIGSAAFTEDEKNVLASFGHRRWQHMFVNGLHEHGIQVVICESTTAEMTDSRKTLLYT